MKQTCILILGMHRSGTSALTGTLSMLDVDLGKDLMQANEGNEKGYFENTNFYNINEDLLSQIDSSWEDVFFDETKLANIQDTNKLNSLLKKEFKDSRIFSIKDPRLAYLFPVYERVLKELDINIKIIIPYRNPIEVASSLTTRNNFSLEKGMLLWAYHILLSEKFSRGHQRIFIEFNELMSNTKDVIQQISEKLKINLNLKYDEKKEALEKFLDTGLKHHNISMDDLPDNTPKIVKDILKLRDNFNQDDITSNFDLLRAELFGYKKLFYNQDILDTAKEASIAKENLKQQLQEKEQELQEKEQELQEKEQYIHYLRELVQSLKLKNRLKNMTPKIIREKTYTLIQTTKRPLKLLKVMDKQYVNKLIKHIKQGNFSYILERMGHYLNQEPSTIHLDLIMSDYDREEVFTFPAVILPKVSIVIPVYNQFDYTHKCLRSILEFTDGVDYEIIIADDVSSDETKDIHKYFKNIKVVRNEKNLGFLLNCNHAAKEAKGEYIFFLNNDTNVQKDWLSILLKTIDNDSTIGMIGSKLVYPDGRQQEAGGIIWNDAEGWNYGRLDNPEKSEYSYVKEVDYISGAAIMIRSKLWKEIGGFDERYVPAYYEDSDLAFEVREHGYKVVMHPKSLVVHFEGISNGTDTSTGMKKYQIVNHKKFYKKWEDVLKAENATHGENLFLARDRSADKKHILIIDHYVPHYDQDAGSRTMWQYLLMLKELDYHITFVGDNFYKHEPYSSLLENAGIEILYGSYYFNNFQNWLQENGKYFDFVYLLRPHIAIKYIDDVKKYTSAKIFYNGTDFHFLRMQREYDISKNKKLLPEIKAIEKQEISLFKKSDCVLTISHYEKEYFKKRFPDWGVEVIPTFIYKEPFPLSINNDFSKREGILFVGGFVHPPNLEGVKWFLKDIWPYILSKHPSMKFYIVGSNMPNEIKAMENENIIIKGFVEEDELSHLYNTVKIVVAPLTFGAGVKGKIIESICHGVPTVTTNTGAEGIIDIDKILLVNDDPLEFANTVNSLYNDVQQCQNIRTEQILYAQKHFSSDSAKNVLEQIFKKE